MSHGVPRDHGMALAGHPSEILPGVPRTLFLSVLSVLTPLACLPVSRCLVSPLQGGQDSSFLLWQLRG